MKIAVTADIHLRSKKEHPERYNALSNILDQMLAEGINTLIIAGDLFDTEAQNYPEFDNLCRQPEYKDINIFVIPGNHDPGINPRLFTADNVRIFNEPEILSFGDPPLSVFFLPYNPNLSMGEALALFENKLPDRWLLIGHGDYLSGIRSPNPYEPGVYMTLNRTDIKHHDPARVILGHIHKKMELGKVQYPGSPSGLDITETGKRSFIVFDTSSLDVSERIIDTDLIFYNETLVALPITDEFGYIRNKIDEMINAWEISEENIPKVRLRLKIKGYTSDKKQLDTVIRDELKDFGFYKDGEPDLGEVNVHSDPERIRIVEKVREEIENMEWDDSTADKEDILEQALFILLKE